MENKLSRRQRAKQRSQNSNKLEVQVKGMKFGSLDDFQRMLMGVASNSSFQYETAEKNSLISYCIDLIADELASNDLFLAKRKGDKNYIPFKNYKRYNHALAKPNKEDTQVTFLKKIVYGLLVEGRVGVVRFEPKKDVVVYEAIQYRYLTKIEDKDKISYRYSYDGKTLDLPEEDVVILSKVGFKDNGKTPQSPVKAAINEIILYNRVIQHTNNHLQNGMISRGVLQQRPESRIQYNSDQLSELSRQFTDATSGARAADTIGLPPGLEFNPIQVKMAEEGLLDLLKEAQDTIFRAFRVPRSFSDNQSDSYATSEVQRKNFYQTVILPLMRLIEDGFNNSPAFTSESEWFQFDKSKILTAEEKKAEGDALYALAQAAEIRQRLNIFTPNDIRLTAGAEILIDDETGEPMPEAEINPLESGIELNNEDQNLDAEQPAQTPDPTKPVAPGAVVDDVRKETFNGAQIQSIVELVQSVARGEMPRDAAINIIMIAFNLDQATAESMMGSAGKGFTIESEEEVDPEPTPDEKGFFAKLLGKIGDGE